MSRPKEVHRLTAASLTVAPPVLGTPTLTVGEIAEQLHPIAPNTSATIERIRHWTKIGLLRPVRHRRSGTGRHRHYSPDASFEAAILNALASVGLELVSRSYVQNALSEAREALRKWHQAKDLGHELPLFFLVILQNVTRTSGEPTVSISEGTIKLDPAAETMIVINLSQLFSHVQPMRTEHVHDDQNS